ncbi:hypothetical protein I5677_04130 [Mobilitalea sibirica]|uniref:Conjugal transfer protein TraX n=1 Tax=Mobilitalea sibirica TaxID=1462919 RepID=A0A8J7KZF2_9FIRM|nr:TraX family protein [Mobilitalea sibirica]MBH1940083.1 hypothetical protein [Mobilitalea sibirica]
MSSFVLKLIAIITMLIDHVGAVFITNSNTIEWLVFRGIGRLAFPIFAFLIVEGLYHTKDVYKYITRMGIFALISEIPFDLAFYGSVLEFKHQNIFFTLTLGLIVINIMHTVEEKYQKDILRINIINAALTLAFSFLAALLNLDYQHLGILLIVGFYLFRGNKVLNVMSILIVLGYLNGDFLFGILAACSMFFIGFYNGERGKNIKYLFYVFYPAHLVIIYLIDRFV